MALFRRKKSKGWLWVVEQSEYAKYAPWIVAQSQHETADWKSSLFNKHKNLFGMKMSEQVEWKGYEGPPAPDGGNYAGYYEWSDSVNHLLNWLRYNNVPPGLNSVDEYVKAIRMAGYYTDSYINYLNGVKRFL